MDKTLEKVTKGPKRVEVGRKCGEKYMNDLKESILNDAKKGSGDTTNKSNETNSPIANTRNETTSPTNNASDETTDPAASSTTTRSNDTYVYGVGMLAVLAIGVCVFFTYNTF